MAKRFTDTEKWKDDWYISLCNDYRIIWQWLTDNCNHAGICKRSIAALNRDCGTSLTEDQLLMAMDGRLISAKDMWFIPKFLKFQYTTLQSKKPAIVSVVKEILKHGFETMIPESFGNNYRIIRQSFDNSSEMIKDKDKVKDMVKDKEEDNNTVEEILINNARENFLIPKMQMLFLDAVPGYAADDDYDYGPLGEISRFICGQENIRSDPATDQQAQDTVLLIWGKMCTTIGADKFFRNQSLKTISNHIQTIVQKFKNGKDQSFTGSQDAGCSDAESLYRAIVGDNHIR